MQYLHFGLVITDRCNAECAFCGPRCGRSGSRVMPEALGRSAIEQAKAFGTFRQISVTGGEAFLYPELTASLLDYAAELGFPTRTVSTNGFWGGWTDDKINEVLTRLSACNMLDFSYDAFHAEWIPARHFWKAVRAASRHGIPYCINVADVPGERGAGPFLSSLGDDALGQKYFLYRLIRSGRAADMPEDCFFPDVDVEKSRCSLRGQICVRYDGALYPCCSSGIFGTEFVMGNLKESPLSDILYSPAAKLRDVLRLQPLFSRLIATAREEWGVRIPDKVVNGCEACQATFRTRERLERAEVLAEEMRRELLMKHLLGERKE